MRQSDLPTLFDRDQELVALSELADAVAAGSGGMVVVDGDAGIGKSGLLRAAGVIARKRGLRVLAARGGELEQEFAFGVTRELFTPALAEGGPGERARVLTGAAALAEPVLSAVPVPTNGAGTDVFAVLHGLYWLTAELAVTMPTLIVVDDAHWCDLPSLRFLAYLARRLDGLRVGLLVAARPDEQPAQQEILLRITAEPAAVVLRPQPLGREAVRSGSAAAPMPRSARPARR